MATIRKHRGKWQVQIRRKGLPSISKTFIAREDALRWSRGTERRVDTGELSPTTPSDEHFRFLQEILDRYEREVTVSKRSRSDHYHLRKIRQHSISTIPISNLTSSDVARFRDDRLKVVSAATICKEINLLGHVISVARREWGLPLREDIVRSIRKPRVKGSRERRIDAIEASLISQSLKQSRNTLVYHVFCFAIATAMRRGEILALRWADVDLNSATAYLPQTKNGEPRRVPLSPQAIQTLRILAEKRNARPESFASHGEALCETTDFVFPISANALRLAWERAKERVGIMDFRFHDLRHEAISRFFEIGLTVPEVALISGHKDPRMLFRYTHLKAENVAQKLAGLRGVGIGI